METKEKNFIVKYLESKTWGKYVLIIGNIVLNLVPGLASKTQKIDDLLINIGAKKGMKITAQFANIVASALIIYGLFLGYTKQDVKVIENSIEVIKADSNKFIIAVDSTFVDSLKK